MPFLLLKQIPRYECLMEAAKQLPDLDPSATEAYLHLLRTGDEVFRVTAQHLAQHNVSQGRFMVLLLLLDKITNCPQPRTPAELADMAGVTRATMTGLVDTLERDELVKREPDPNDRRMMLIYLTAKGQALLQTIVPGHFQGIAAVMRALSENERKTLVRLLTKIVEQVATTPPSPATAQVP